MAKLDEDFFNELRFVRNEKTTEGYAHKDITLSCTHKEIYRQYEFIFDPNLQDEKDLPGLEYEGKRIIAWSIYRELNQANE